MVALRVVAAIIRQEDRYLLTQRLPGALRGLLWEFPGGKVEEGESEKEALARELREELGLEIEAGEQLGRLCHSYPDLELELSFYACRIRGGRPQALQCLDWAWAGAEEVTGYDLAEADRLIWQALQG